MMPKDVKRLESLQNPLVKDWHRLVRSKKEREAQGILLVEGKHVVQDLMGSSSLLALIAKDPSYFSQADESIPCYEITDRIVDRLTTVECPEGIFALVKVPETTMEEFHGKTRILVLDGIQDPGNLGTLFRTALAFGWDAIYLLQGTCDPMNPKALRSSKGGTLRLPWLCGDWENMETFAKENKYKIWVADIHGKSLDEASQSINENVILVLGNEAQGPSEEVLKGAEAVSIKMNEGTESLNVAVAGGIIMNVFRKRSGMS
jgi:TrmH family RNA methyltransferase